MKRQRMAPEGTETSDVHHRANITLLSMSLYHCHKWVKKQELNASEKIIRLFIILCLLT